MKKPNTSLQALDAGGYLTRAQAAKYLGVSERTVSDWQARHIIPYIKPARKCVRFKRADLDAAMLQFTVSAYH